MPIEPLPEAFGEPLKVGDSLDALRRRFGLPAPSALDAVRAGWSELVGDALAARSEVVDLREGTLRVRADDPAAAERLRWNEATILAEAYPGQQLAALSVRVSPRRAPR